MTNGQDPDQAGKLCSCPYCEASSEEPLPFCSVCGKEVARCSSCGAVVKIEDRVCSGCGGELLGEGTDK